MDFTRGIIKARDKPYHNIGKTVYKDSKWYVRTTSKLLEIINNDISNSLILYSLPCNDRQKEWTKCILSTPLSEERIKLAKFYWSKYKPGMKVEGEVKCKFKVINKYE